MKSKNVQKLQEEHPKYCKQMGIVEVPHLILTRRELHALQISTGQQKYGGGWGSCHRSLKAIFVDTGVRVHHPSREYKGWKNHAREMIKHKSKYIDFRSTLVHELVHYRWPKMPHGKRFERRIVEILRGKTFDEPKAE
jgi:hypothetical protein